MFPDNRMRKAIIAVICIAALATIAGSMYVLNMESGALTPAATSTPETTAPSTTIQLAMLDISGTGRGKKRGCDSVVLVPIDVPRTEAPLTAALRELFALSTTSFGGAFNFIDRTNETLSFDRAEVSGGVARVYLTGSLSGLAGVCDDPRAQIQIEETALQFSTVHHVEIYLNGNLSSLTPSEQ